MNTNTLNGINDDSCQINQRVKQSVRPLDYRLYIEAHEHPERCMYPMPELKTYCNKNISKQTDIESDLWNIKRYTKCIPDQFHPQNFNFGTMEGPYQHCQNKEIKKPNGDIYVTYDHNINTGLPDINNIKYTC